MPRYHSVVLAVALTHLVPAATLAAAPASADPAAASRPAKPKRTKVAAKTERLEISIDQPVKVFGDVEVTLKSAGHRHLARGGTRSRWLFEVEREGKVETAKYSYGDDDLHWYMEGVSHSFYYRLESLFPFGEEKKVLTSEEDQAKNQRRKLTIRPHRGPIYSAEQAREEGLKRARAEADKRGCKKGNSSTSALSSPGVVSYSRLQRGTLLCKLLVGVYSGRVYYQAGAEAAPATE